MLVDVLFSDFSQSMTLSDATCDSEFVAAYFSFPVLMFGWKAVCSEETLLSCGSMYSLTQLPSSEELCIPSIDLSHSPNYCKFSKKHVTESNSGIKFPQKEILS